MELTYDPDTNVAYLSMDVAGAEHGDLEPVTLLDKGVDLDVVLDIGVDGRLHGIEFLWARSQLAPAVLRGARRPGDPPSRAEKPMTETLKSSLAMWDRQREQRLARGDVLERPRLVEHTADFLRCNDADAAAARLATRGYRVAVRRRGWRSFVVSFDRVSPLTDIAVRRFLDEVTEIILDDHGSYDGFGATVETE